MQIQYHFPKFTAAEAIYLAREYYHLAVTAHPLPSERDQNFHLKADSGQEYVLKIANATEQRELLDLQNQALEHLAARAPALALSRVCPAVSGQTIIPITSPTGETHLMRLLTYIPGQLWAQVNPHTPELLHSLGQVLGTIDQALADFSHPAARRTLKWDLPHAAWIREYLPYLADPTRRAIVEKFLTRFETEVLPVLPGLRASIIYNDANDYNILVSQDDPRQRRVVGVIDFGDMTHTQTVCDLAIAAAYALMDKPDPLAAAAHMVRGYHAAFPLTEAELAVLFPLICIRLCITVTNAAYQRHIEPDNAYLIISERPAWDLLTKLAEIPPQLAHYMFRQACGLPACPHTPALVEWLRANADRFGRVVEPDLKTANPLVFDLSVGSLELGNSTDFADSALFTHKLFGRIKAANVPAGIGKYNEARPLYTSELFKADSNAGPEWRTVHTGLDIFMAAGSAVFAPLDGVVHSFRNNAGALDYGPTIILEHTVEQTSKVFKTFEVSSTLTFYTLYGHLSVDSLEGLVEGQPVKQGERLGQIGDSTINGGWPPHLHFQIITDMLGRSGEFPGVARPSQCDLWLNLSPDPNLILGIPALLPPQTKKAESGAWSIEQILSVRRQHIGPNLSISYRQPLKIVRGYRQYLYNEEGQPYLDAVNNVPHVGHSHPYVVKAGQEQMAVLNTNTRYLHESLVRYAERLTATLPEPLRVCYFVCSGSEANELALRLARTHTGQKDTVVVDVGYHGNTTSLIEISPYKHDGPGGAGAPPYVHNTPMPDVYRGAYKKDDPQAGAKYAQAVAAAIEQIQADGKNVAAFICESILSCGGQVVLPEGYLREVYRHVRAAGGVCIADEVQVGLGRAGTHFWAFETQGVVPDIVTIGKPIGNGHPLAAVITTPELAASFNNGMEYFNTFGGNPVSCAIGMAVLDVIEAEGLQAHALKVGRYMLEKLQSLMDRHPIIGDVRGLGLFIGIELVLNRETLEPAGDHASYISNRMRDHGILVSTDGPFHNVLKIKPPLVFDEANADFFVTTLDKILWEDFVRLV